MKKSIGAVIIIAVLALTSACGGSSDRDEPVRSSSAPEKATEAPKTTRPSEAEIAEALFLEGGQFSLILGKDQAPCWAKTIFKSGLSDEYLRDFVASGSFATPGDADDGFARNTLNDELLAACG